MMLVVIRPIELALLVLILVGVSLRSSGRSRRHSDRFLVGPFAGTAAVSLVSVWIAAITFFIPAPLTTGVRFLTTFGVIIAAPVTIICLTLGWLRR